MCVHENLHNENLRNKQTEHENQQPQDLKKRYEDAVESFINKVRNDPNIIAVILCGSLSYDTVWEKSDIDMTMIVRDQKLTKKYYSLIEDDIIISLGIVQRSEFKRDSEKSPTAFISGNIAKGQIVYTTDDSLYDYLEDLKKIGESDVMNAVFAWANGLFPMLDKSEKWIRVKHDPLYAQYYLLRTAEIIANIELLLNHEIPTREAVLQAKVFAPDLIRYFYEDAMAFHWSEERVWEAIQKLKDYIDSRLDIISRPVIELMRDGEIRSLSQISEYLHSGGLAETLDYLCEKNILAKASNAIHLTPKGRSRVDEAVYVYIPV